VSAVEDDFVYFRSVEGRAVPRFGTDVFIGCVKTKDGFVFSNEPVAVPKSEERRYRREYNNAVRRGDLVSSPGLDAQAADGAEQ